MSTTALPPTDQPVESGTQVTAHSVPNGERQSKEFRIRPATRSDVPAIVSLLGEAFQDGDPISEWMFPDERKRQRRQSRMITALVLHRHLPVDGVEVAVSGDEIVGVSLFRRSWRKPSTTQRLVGDLALLRALRSKVLAGLAVDTALHAAAPSGPNICLIYLACNPSWLRMGVGTALFTSLFDKCTEVGAAFYGIMKPENFTYYTSVLDSLPALDDLLSEAVAGEITIGHGGPTVKTLGGRPHY
jgi:predicted N-acetyltransferase YhbS